MQWLVILLLVSLVTLLVVGASLAVHICRRRRELQAAHRAEQMNPVEPFAKKTDTNKEI